MLKMYLTLLLLSLSVEILSQNCANPNPSLDLIDSGKVLLQRKGGSREHCFNVPINYPIPLVPQNPDIAVSSSRINGYNPFGGFDYSISAGRLVGVNSISINVQINEDNKWSVIQVSYIISNNRNIVIGSFIGNMFRLTSCSGSNTNSTTLQTYIPTWRINNQTNYKVAVFISGLRTLDDDFSVRITQAELDKIDGRIVIQVMSNASPGLQYIYLTFIVYPTSPTNNLEFRQMTGDQSSTYRLQGIASFLNSRGINYNQFAICSRAPGISCPPNEVAINQKCQCVRGFVRVQNTCRVVCSFNGYINQFNQCVCLNGFVFNQQRICIPTPQCGENKTFSPSGGCVCKQGFYLSNRRTCVPYCPLAGQIWNGTACICIEGFFRIPNGQCIKQITCQQNQMQQGNQCVCVPGFTRDINGNCIPPVQCQRNQINNRGVCQCAPGFARNRRGNCVPFRNDCRRGQIFNTQTGQCDCPPSTVRSGFNCVPAGCPPGFQSMNGRCICQRGTAKIGSICRPCPPGSQSSNDGETCICPQNSILTVQRDFTCTQCPPNSTVQNNACNCIPGHIWLFGRSACVPQTPNCPPNASPDANGRCNCNNGFQFTPNRQSCIPSVICPTNGFIGPLGACVCNNGFYLQGNQCKTVPTCPQNSVWNQNQLRCECRIPNQYLINNTCQSCGRDQSWNSKQCVCNQGLFRINGVCRVCDIFSKYNGTDCECNIGYFGNRDKCEKCHPSCGRCSGPEANQCITCVDITFTLAKGYCAKDTPCPIGFYLNDSTCARCSDYCQLCVNELECGQCSVGFKIELIMTQEGTAYSICSANCGDGRRVDIQKCDDGNLLNDDGCNRNCEIQNGWYCSGGTSMSKSICKKGTPPKIILQVKGAVNLLGKVVQGVRLFNIPNCFTDNDCQNCFKLLQVKVIQGNVPTQTNIIYVPNSQGQFIIQYDFGSAITSTFFKYMIQINKNLMGEYGGCLSSEDFAQQVTGEVNTAQLAKNDRVEKLSFGNINLTPKVYTNTRPKLKSNLAVNFGSNAPYNQTVLRKLDSLFMN